MQYEATEVDNLVFVMLQDGQETRGLVWSHGKITLSRPRRAGVGVSLVLALSLVGCAPARPPVIQPQATGAPTGPSYATVAAVRPIRTPGAGASDPGTAILDAMGVSREMAAGASSEIVVRTDRGETLSVVQPSAANLTPGERVMVVPGGLPRLVPLPPQG